MKVIKGYGEKRGNLPSMIEWKPSYILSTLLIIVVSMDSMPSSCSKYLASIVVLKYE